MEFCFEVKHRTYCIALHADPLTAIESGSVTHCESQAGLDHRNSSGIFTECSHVENIPWINKETKVKNIK